MAGYINESYAYTYGNKVPTPSLKTLTSAENPDASWVASFAARAALPAIEDAFEAIPRWLKSVFERITHHHGNAERDDRIKDFCNLIVNTEDVVAWRHVDERCKIVVTDEAFASYRVSGPNAAVIRLATLDNLQRLVPELQGEEELLRLVKRKLLFYVDYSKFAEFSPGKSPENGLNKLTMGSIALFKLEGNDLKPVLIKLNSYGANPRTRVFRPMDSGNGMPDFAWAIAKMVFQSNDADHLEACSHLGGTHLVAESFMVATMRRLPPTHPLHKLLVPHFRGTAFINYHANKDLVGDGQPLDLLVSGNIAKIRETSAMYNAEVLASDLRFPQRLESSGMSRENVPDLIYPYRDDGMLYWDAIHQWVTEYLAIFYQADEAVATDQSLINWIEELRDNGKVSWLNGFDFTIDWLRDLVASVIFLASVEHAAVNFPERTHMEYVPAFPLAIYGDEETVFKDAPTEDDLLQLLPRHKMSFKQVLVMNVLGGVYHTQLGQYEHGAEHFRGIETGLGLTVREDYFDEVHLALTKFQNKLQESSEEIKIRNKTRKFPYETLLLEKIPQSINI